MFFCNDCGQSKHISDDNFIEIRYTSGWESNQIDPEDGEYIEFIDGETSDSSHDTYECPYCGSTEIESEWNGTEKDAKDLRIYHIEQRKIIKEQHELNDAKREFDRKAKDPDRKWDVEANV